jgi:glycosyltransferase involved in cell wall biosynthesis
MATNEAVCPKRICMVSYSFYESDNRIIRYAEALAERGDSVEVVALRRSAKMPRSETINGVIVHRVQDRFGKDGTSAWSFLWPLLQFLAVSARWLQVNSRPAKFDLVHIHNIPDFLIFAGLPAKLHGARLILDIHDIVPEFFASKFGAKSDSRLVRMLRLMEKTSARAADRIILANHLWLGRYTSRSAPAEKCSVFINYVDRQIFHPQPKKQQSDGPVILYPGGLQWHQGIDIAIRAFALLKQRLPDVRFHIYGEGSHKGDLIGLSKELDVQDSVKFFDPLSLRDIAKVMSEADVGVAPKRADSFGNEAYSTKIMEFMAVGVPMIASDALINRHYFDDSVLCFFKSGDEVDLAEQMHRILTDQRVRDSLVANAHEYVERNSWSRHKEDYFRLVDTLVAD